jgi:hypothetical protein
MEKTRAKKTKSILITVFVVFALTVATNLGEFWPFSIYPMFSQGGKTWSRSLVREMPQTDSLSWEAVPLDDLPGLPFSVRERGVDPIDLANFVSKTKTWDSVRVAALERMLFNGAVPDVNLMVFKVQGRLTDTDGVDISATPYVLIAPGADQINPVLAP